MLYIRQHIKTIIDTFQGDMPLSLFLKNYCKCNPKLGSRDRKILGTMVYSFYRTSKGFSSTSISLDERIGLALWLCGGTTPHLQQFIPETLQTHNIPNLSERLTTIQEYTPFEVDKICSYSQILSAGITQNEWLYNMLTQPMLFIRIRKEKNTVTSILEQQGITYEWMNDTCMALPNGTAIDKILPDTLYVVQDAASQETGEYFNPEKNEAWYDCCAGAGGKSLLLKDIEPSVQLTVSDKRKSILHNLETRFQQYNHAVPTTYCLDVSDPQVLEQHLDNTQFQAILCDVPCTGSGTWARTPEQLYFFNETFLTEISLLQAKIAVNVAPYIKQGGKLLYITCSVFKKENEDVINSILAQTKLELESMQLINGIERGADSMFIAVLRKH
jgi:16S rRNA (cytosine967-C5)-methyltransferase